MEPMFNEGDAVFCYEPMLGRARALYEAKVTGVVRRRTRETAYKLKFFDWNKIYKDRPKKCSYDHEVPESFLCPVNERRRQLMNKITRAVSEIEDSEEKIKVVSDILLHAYNTKRIKSLPPGLDIETESVDGQGEDESLVNATQAESEYMVEIELDCELKKILENDYLQVKNQGKMMSTQSPSVISILEGFMRYHGHSLLFDKPKNLKDSYRVEHRISLTKEVLEGIRCLFDIIISTNLLYSEEQHVHDILIRGDNSLLQQEPTEPVSRRKTRSSTADAPPSDVITPFAQYSTSEVFRTSASTQQLLNKLEQHTDSLAEGSSTKKPRLSAHLQANIQHSASGRSTPTQNVQTENLWKEVNDWRLIPQDVVEAVRGQLPSSKYGAVYLLRLFVKLPEILTKMRLAEEWRTFLLGVFHHILSYLLEEKATLFDGSSYITIPSAPLPTDDSANS